MDLKWPPIKDGENLTPPARQPGAHGGKLDKMAASKSSRKSQKVHKTVLHKVLQKKSKTTQKVKNNTLFNVRIMLIFHKV